MAQKKPVQGAGGGRRAVTLEVSPEMLDVGPGSGGGGSGFPTSFTNEFLTVWTNKRRRNPPSA